MTEFPLSSEIDPTPMIQAGSWRLFKHLFCLDEDFIEERDLSRIACWYGVETGNAINVVLKALRASKDRSPGGDAPGYDLSWKNERKREYYLENCPRYALLNGREDEGHSFQRFRHEFERRSLDFDVYWLDSFSVDGERVQGIDPSTSYHAVFLTNPEPLESDAAPIFLLRRAVISWLEKHYRVIPSFEEDLVARSKLDCLLSLKAGGIPTPRTLVTSSIAKAARFVEELHDEKIDVVIKPVTKGGGWAVAKIPVGTSKDMILDILGKYKWWYGAGVLLVQEFIKNNGFDMRILAIDDLVIGVERRRVTDENRSWIYNISKGAVGEPGDLPDPALVFTTLGAVNQFFCGIDLIQDLDGKNYILEVNSCPGFAGFEKYLNINVASFVVDYVTFFTSPAKNTA